MTERNEDAAKLVRSDGLLEEAFALLDKLYAVWMSDNTGNDFIDALDPLMWEVEKFLEANISNAESEALA